MYLKYFMIAVFSLTACGAIHAEDNYGTIYANTPQVYTRERLIDQRFAEYQWLQKQLKTDAEVTLQGISDGRLSSSFNFNNKLLITPGLNPAVSTMTNSPPTTASPAFQNYNLYTNLPTTNATPLSPSAAAVATSEISPLDRIKLQETYRSYLQALSMQQELDDSHDLNGSTIYTLEFELTVTPGDHVSRPGVLLFDVNVPPEERLSTKKLDLWLDRLNLEIGFNAQFWSRRLCDQADAFMIGKCLDAVERFQKDDHGLLNFKNNLLEPINDLKKVRPDLVIPSSASEANKISVLNAPSLALSSSSILQETYNLNLKEITKAIKEKSLVSNKLIEDFQKGVKEKSDDEVEKIIKLLKDLLADPSTAYKSLSQIPLKSDQADDAAIRASNRYLLSEATLISTTYWYLDNLAPYIQADFKKDVAHNIWGMKVGWRTTEEKGKTLQTGIDNFDRKFGENTRLVVQSVKPDEYTQNISDTSTLQRTSDWSLALSAPLLKGISFDSFVRYMQTTQDIFETIKRQPLLVSFGRGGSQFGWLIGPQFFIRDRKATFNQTDVKYHVTVSLVVPGWYHSINVRGEYGWLDEDGHVIDRKWLWTSNTSYHVPQPSQSSKSTFRDIPGPSLVSDWAIPAPGNANGIVNVQLPANETLLTTLLFAQPKVYRRPLLEGPANRLGIKTSDTTQTLLVRGQELWRNPTVVVGSTPADFVTIMPDMQSVLATFNSFHETPSAGSNTFPLSIFTSFGSDEIGQGVNFSSTPTGAASIGKIASLQTLFYIQDKMSGLTFTLDDGQFPTGYAKLQASIRPETGDATTSTAYPASDHRSIKASFNPPSPVKSGVYFAELLLQSSPESGELKSLMKDGPTMFNFIASDDILPRFNPTIANSLKFKPVNPSLQDIQISVPRPDLLFLAHPGLKSALEKKTVVAEFQFKGQLYLSASDVTLDSNNSINIKLNGGDFAKDQDQGTSNDDGKTFSRNFTLTLTYEGQSWMLTDSYPIVTIK